jgi:hypothetical protein
MNRASGIENQEFYAVLDLFMARTMAARSPAISAFAACFFSQSCSSGQINKGTPSCR